MSFAEAADDIQAPERKPGSSFADAAADIPSPKKAAPAAPSFKTDDPAAMRRQIVASGDAALLEVFDRQFPPDRRIAGPGRGLVPASAYARPDPSVPLPIGQKMAMPEQEQSSWWRRAGRALNSAGETALALGTGTVFGIPLGLMNAANAVGTGQDVEQAFGRGVELGTIKPRSAEGADMLDDAMHSEAMRAVQAIGPMRQVGLAAASVPIGQMVSSATGRSMAAAQDAFSSKQQPPRIEPTLKPMYRRVDGQWQQVNAEGAPVAQVSPQSAAPTIAQATPELQAAYAKAKAAGSLNNEAAARHIEADTLPIPIRLTEGEALASPRLMSEERNSRAGANPRVTPEFYNQRDKALVQNAYAIRDMASPTVSAANPVESGQLLVDRYKAMDAPIRADISAKYKALADANGGDLPVNGSSFVQAADQALSKKFKSRYLPAEVSGDLAELRDGGPMTYQHFEELRTTLAAEARKADRAGDGNRAAAVGIVRDALESLPMDEGAAQLKPLADAARKAAAARFARIKADPAYKAAISDDVAMGEPSPLADKFVKSYVIDGNVASVKQMRANLVGDQAAGEAIAGATLNHLISRSGADPTTGTFSQSGWNRALGDIAPKLDQLLDPKSAQLVTQLGNVARNIGKRQAGHYVNESGSGVVLMGAAANAAEGVANVAAHGVPIGTWARKAVASASAKNAAKKATEPGAGMTRINDFPGTKTEPKQ